MFYAQSWAFTHYLMIGDDREHAAKLSDFLRLLQEDTPAQEAATRAFGNLKNLERSLDGYVRSMIFYHYQVPARLSAKKDEYPIRTLSDAESLAARGEVLVHVGRPEEARQNLEQALQLDDSNSRAYQGMGMLFARQNDQETAGKYFTAGGEAGLKELSGQLLCRARGVGARESGARRRVSTEIAGRQSRLRTRNPGSGGSSWGAAGKVPGSAGIIQESRCPRARECDPSHPHGITACRLGKGGGSRRSAGEDYCDRRK